MKIRKNYFFQLVLCLFFMASGCSKKTSVSNTPVNTNPPASEKPYSLVWSDEFQADGQPDKTKWNYDIGGNGWGNNELQYYTDRMENARVADGHLIIETKKETYSGRNYTSARLLTKNKAQWTFGKFEIRAKLPSGIGTWPAIWLLAAADPLRWPDDGELDIMEEVGFNPNVIHGTVHNKLYNGANGLQKGSTTTIPDAQTAFHVYSMEWTPTVITWAVDDHIFFTYDQASYPGEAWPYNKDFFMILNVAIGGNWGGKEGVDDSIFPQQMLIDYVRVYQRK
jgi:beta-glucanase (GH16 family)